MLRLKNTLSATTRESGRDDAFPCRCGRFSGMSTRQRAESSGGDERRSWPRVAALAAPWYHRELFADFPSHVSRVLLNKLYNYIKGRDLEGLAGKECHVNTTLADYWLKSKQCVLFGRWLTISKGDHVLFSRFQKVCSNAGFVGEVLRPDWQL